mmetsp:Transcript_2322/g.4317  ORF Transcript_2322/g.4317 Transcript_2322/m.4317 type:complete len:419 (-) Transcript_2322:575-1831(-)|eukprot:CAMPEP_0176487284 /NCGR_PEP_ID=MMETSP0200_2-20121128/6039_1 /TAXON_ID=947934 /ORGANISM="Chaetoceros sp., Strain GSL56" /LENGTH=418 /DNA_ID=CAMNT_0017884081 /DNA_START=815 /DNA_END=2071 /DNA_ORIENTATION=-
MKFFKKKSHKSGYCNISEPISDLDPRRISAIKSRHVSELDPKVISAIKAQHLEATTKAAMQPQNLDKDGTDVTISLTPSPSQQSSRSAQVNNNNNSNNSNSKIIVTTIQDGSPASTSTTFVDSQRTPSSSSSGGGAQGVVAKAGTKYFKSPTTVTSKRLFGITTTPTTTASTTPKSSMTAMTGTMVGNGNGNATTPSPSGVTTAVLTTPSCKPPIAPPKTPDTFFQGRNRKRVQDLDQEEVDTQMPVHYFEQSNNMDHVDHDHGRDNIHNDPSSDDIQGRSHGKDTTSPQLEQENSLKKTASMDDQKQAPPQSQPSRQKKQLPVHLATPTNGIPFLQRSNSAGSDLDKSFSPDIISVHSDITDPSFHSHSNNRKSSSRRRSWHLKIRDGFRDTCRQHNLKSPMSFLEMILDSICSGPR